MFQVQNSVLSSRQLVRCVFVHPVFRSYAKLSRLPVRVYDPKGGELKRMQSLPKIPTAKKDEANAKQLEQIKTSGELFRSVMSEIFSTKSKSMIALEGGRLVEEGINFGLKLKYLFLLKSLKTYPAAVEQIVESESSKTENSYEYYPVPKVAHEVHRIGLRVLQEWSTLETTPGIIGVFDKPSESDKKGMVARTSKNIQSVPLTVVLDNLRDPGNLGSILRSAAGIGCKLFLSKGCVDPWEMKALRGGNGAQFMIPMQTEVNLESFHQYIDPEELFQNRDAENQAQNTQSGGIGIFLADSGIGDDRFGLPIVPYTSINYSSFSSIYLILGGETSGLSNTVKKAVASLQQIYPEQVKCVTRINVPMHLPIDSLNVANAFGIIGYEIARQFSNR